MKYNEAQEQAINHNTGPMMVLAGPGSGKTTVIINRTKNLIEQYGVDPRKILVITFTKAAAQEMKERFIKLVNNENNESQVRVNRNKDSMLKNDASFVNFGTFHAIFFNILRQAYRECTYDSIIKQEDKMRLIKEIVLKYDIETEDEKELLADIESEISLVKGEMMDVNNYYSQSCPQAHFRSIYNEYNDTLQSKRLIDFDDMIVKCYQLFTAYPQILNQWQKRYEYILIDEFQDINLLQYKIMQMLAKPENNIFIVGDDDQSIYRFRGAKPEIMLNFTKDYPDSKVCNLDINYRCSGHIVDIAGRIIKNNKKRYDKNIRTINQPGRNVEISEFKTINDQSIQIIEDIKNYLSQGIPYSQMAILYRTNSQPRRMVEKLMEYNLPFIIKDGLPSIYNHWISETMLYYLKAAKQCFGCKTTGEMGSRLIDRTIFMKIANKPNRYISRAVMTSQYIDFESLKSNFTSKEWMLERLDNFEYDLSKIAKMDMYSSVNYIRKAVGYDEYLEDYATSRKINLEELYEVLDEFQENCKDMNTLDELLEHIDNYNEELERNLSKAREISDAINMITFHGAKGLEFKVVFIIDANEGITPYKKAVLEADIEEERRMFYVAVTRAKTYLHIYYSKDRFGKEMQPSRYVGEALVDRESIQEGVQIKHKVYGAGKIVRADEKRITVKFSNMVVSKILDIEYCVSNRLIEIK